MIKKALAPLLKELLALVPQLWLQVIGISAAISLSVLILNIHASMQSKTGTLVTIAIALVIVLFAATTFSVFLLHRHHLKSAKLGLRKLLGTRSWKLLVEATLQTSFLVVLAMLISFGVIDVSTMLAGLNFTFILKNIGVMHYSLFMLGFFLLSVSALFVIQGIALAPKAKDNITKTTLQEKQWFISIKQTLANISLYLCALLAVSLVVLVSVYHQPVGISLLLFFYFAFLMGWCLLNKQQQQATPEAIF